MLPGDQLCYFTMYHFDPIGPRIASFAPVDGSTVLGPVLGVWSLLELCAAIVVAMLCLCCGHSCGRRMTFARSNCQGVL